MKILIVDDLAINLKLLQVILESEGHEVVTAIDGVEAIEILSEIAIDAIISDILMPRMDGYQLCAKVRQTPAFQSIPFIFYTATFTSPADEQLCYNLGADKYLRKPASAEHILQALHESCQKNISSIRETSRSFDNLRVMKQYSEQLVLKLEEKNRELKLTLDRLHANDERFRQVVESIGEVFWMADADKQNMIYVSPGYEKIWGRSVDSLYENPLNWVEAIHPEDRDRVFKVLKSQAQETYDIEYRIVRPDNSIRWVHDRAFPVQNGEGKAYRVVGVATDITERKNIEQQLFQSQKMEAIGQLSAGIAHDFNNLLTVILGNLFLLKVANLSADIADPLLEIRKASEQAANLTRQLLLFARGQKMQMTSMNLNAALADTIKMLSRILGEHIQVDFQASAIPLPIEADHGMLDQVLMNLAVNARDAMPKGGKFRVETEKKTLTKEDLKNTDHKAAGNFAVISVSDSGCGIPAAILPKVFEPFFTTKEVGKGTGLGLATVFGIVQQHEGWITVESQEGIGTTFRIFLPLTERGEEKKINSKASLQTAPGGTETILVVEDETSIRLLLSKYLSHLGYTILQASDSLEAVTRFDEYINEIALVFTDLVMPGGMHGTELAEMMKNRKPALRFVFSSGFSEQINVFGAPLTEGVNFLAKPFNLPAVARIIRAQLDA